MVIAQNPSKTVNAGNTKTPAQNMAKITRRNPQTAVIGPVKGMVINPPIPNPKSIRPSCPSSNPTRALANGTSGAHAAIITPTVKNTVRVANISRAKGRGDIILVAHNPSAI
jgi:hypothetical protein